LIMAFYLNGERLVGSKGFTDSNGVQYPANWLSLSTEEERQAIGIVEVEQKVQPKATAKAAPKPDLDDKTITRPDGNTVIKRGMKGIALGREEETLVKALKDSDHYVLRKFETGEDIPEKIAEYRSGVREVYKKRVSAIEKCKSIKSLNKLFSDREALPVYPSQQL
jgi:hypothetical protein